MKTYQITAIRESDGGEVVDRFTESTEKEARKSFSECYRHDKYTITNIEVVNDKATASKEQERKALEEIQKIIDNLGPESYIGTAFKGVAQVATFNIDCDAADSLFDQLESARAREKEYKKKAVQAERIAGEVSEKIAYLEEQLIKAQSKAIPAHLYKWLYILVSDEQEKCDKSIMENAAIIAKNNKESGIATRSLERLPNLFERKEWLGQTMAALEAIEPEGI